MHRRTFLAASAIILSSRGVARATGTPSASPTADAFVHPAWFVDPDPTAAKTRGTIMFGTAKEYVAAHIPATDVLDWTDLELVESTPESLTSWTQTTIDTLHEHGIAVGSPLTICDWGTAYAPRLFWVLTYLGSTDLAILNGGLPAWIAAGGGTETGEAIFDYVAIKDVQITPNPSVLATIDEVEQAVTEHSAQFIDARTSSEFASGHLPGAINIPFLDNTVGSQGGIWKSAPELTAMYTAAGIDLAAPIIPYCSTGVRSAATWFTLAALGVPNVRLFSGSWREWTADPTRPIET